MKLCYYCIEMIEILVLCFIPITSISTLFVIIIEKGVKGTKQFTVIPLAYTRLNLSRDHEKHFQHFHHP